MRPWFGLVCALWIPAALAADGAVQGSLEVNGTPIALKYAAAHLHDNAEKLLDRPQELRIVLADRALPADTLNGIAFLPATRMAREGAVKGLLLKLDPSDASKVEVTILQQPPDPGLSLVTQTLSSSPEPVIKGFSVAGGRVKGEIARRDTRGGSAELPSASYTLRFDAPLGREPAVTADLKGKAAQDSPQARVLRDKARALAKADFDTLRRLSTERARRSHDEFIKRAGERAAQFARQAGPELEKSVKRLQRIVVRGERAVGLLSENEWMTFAREGGEWRSDD